MALQRKWVGTPSTRGSCLRQWRASAGNVSAGSPLRTAAVLWDTAGWGSGGEQAGREEEEAQGERGMHTVTGRGRYEIGGCGVGRVGRGRDTGQSPREDVLPSEPESEPAVAAGSTRYMQLLVEPKDRRCALRSTSLHVHSTKLQSSCTLHLPSYIKYTCTSEIVKTTDCSSSQPPDV